MKRILFAAAILAGLLVVGFSSFSFLDSTDCEWEELNIEGETFDSQEQFFDRAEEEGLDIDDATENFEFEERENALYYRSLDCGVGYANEN